MKCAEIGCYSTGILTFSQLLILFNHKIPEERRVVAHEILKEKVKKENYDKVLGLLLTATSKKQQDEISKSNKREEISSYLMLLVKEGFDLIKSSDKNLYTLSF